MLFKKLTAAAAASMLAMGSVAAAQTAQPLSVANAPALRASADVDGNALRGDEGTMQFAGLIAIALIIWGLSELFESDGPDSP